MSHKRSYLRLIIVALVAFLIGCQGQQVGSTAKGGLTGGAIGAGLGAIIGHETGSTGAGIAIGSAIGALSGALVGRQVEQVDQQIANREQRIADQDRLIEENRRLLQELRAGGADVRTTDRGVVINLPDVLFEFDSARLTSEAVRTAQDIAKALKNISNRTISVEGHTDSIGTMAYNQRLSEHRARSVADELVFSGVSRSRVRVRGFGESQPIASNESESGRSRNRRVEVIVENR